MLKLLPFVLLSSCASLTQGWARLSVPHGRIEKQMLCRMEVEKDDVLAECVPLPRK